jgi:putative hydrolase of the HAD superfamily
MISGISAVAFDLDGTLYPNFRFYRRLLPFLLKHGRLLAAFGKARNVIRREQKLNPSSSISDFYRYQAQLTANILKVNSPEAMALIGEKIEKLIYRGWEGYFTSIKMFPGVRELLTELRSAGLALGMLSDFPPQVKLENMGISGFWNVVLCSESTGALKPASKPFIDLANALGVPPEQILYVGNSYRYDVIGAMRAGMKTARIVNYFCCERLLSGIFTGKPSADFYFHDYRQLHNFVLQ